MDETRVNLIESYLNGDVVPRWIVHPATIREFMTALRDAWRERDSIPWTKDELRVAQELGTLQSKLFHALERAERAERERDLLKESKYALNVNPTWVTELKQRAERAEADVKRLKESNFNKTEAVKVLWAVREAAEEVESMLLSRTAWFKDAPGWVVAKKLRRALDACSP